MREKININCISIDIQVSHWPLGDMVAVLRMNACYR